MTSVISFVGEGVGDMAVVECDDGSTILIDCHLTPATKPMAMPTLFTLADASQIEIFVTLQVERRRVFGLGDVAQRMFIRKFWDAGSLLEMEFEGFETYKSLRDSAGAMEIDGPIVKKFGSTKISVVRARPTRTAASKPGGPIILRLADIDPGTQKERGSILFASNATGEFWDEALSVLPPETIASDVLVAGDHGGRGFFDGCNVDSEAELIGNLEKLNPTAVVIGDVEEKAEEREAMSAHYDRYVAAQEGRALYSLAKEGAIAFTIDAKGVSVEEDSGGRLLKAAA